ncbi:MAG: GDSL family lipase [Lachnospiraceae bacterium]|nr:GDSL family lipase [Lachnospiraceae bacterium]
MSELRTLGPDEIPLHLYGRTNWKGDGPIELYWSASGIEFRVAASELWVRIEAEYDQYEQWVAIEVNGTQVIRMMLKRGGTDICIFRGLSAQTPKTVRIFKEMQAIGEDPSRFVIHSVSADGMFLPIAPKKMKIEFVGDSITSGEGVNGAHEEMDWVPMVFGTCEHYANYVAKALDADYHLVSQSGWGVYCGWDNNPMSALPEIYTKVCGAASGAENAAAGTLDEYDFSSWQPDVVVINLGTNDDGAFHNAPYTDPKTGKIYAQLLNADGTYEEMSIRRFCRAMDGFLGLVRRKNPNARIVWCYGALGDALMPFMQRTLREYVDRTGDKNVDLLRLPNTTMGAFGSRCHPGPVAHRRMANALIAYLKRTMNHQ